MTEKNLPPFELKVYRSPKDKTTVFGQGVYGAMISGREAVWPCVIHFGTPVAEAYRLAREFADAHGIELRIIDEEKLFDPLKAA